VDSEEKGRLVDCSDTVRRLHAPATAAQPRRSRLELASDLAVVAVAWATFARGQYHDERGARCSKA
jgi:hypothetical protein